MNRDEIWAAYAEHKERTVQLLEQLDPAEWNHPTLCDRWTVRDLAGHLTMQGMTPGDIARTLAQPRLLAAAFGGTNKLICEMGKARGRAPIDRLLNQIRENGATRRVNPGLTEQHALVDIVVHSQDLAIPLGRTLPIEPATAGLAADRIIADLGTRIANVMVDLGVGRYQLVASDLDWSRGTGPLVQGPITSLLMLVAGRSAALEQLSGPGAEQLRRAATADRSRTLP